MTQYQTFYQTLYQTFYQTFDQTLHQTFYVFLWSLVIASFILCHKIESLIAEIDIKKLSISTHWHEFAQKTCFKLTRYSWNFSILSTLSLSIISNSWRRLIARIINVWSNVSIDLIDEIKFVRTMKLKKAMTARSAQFEAKKMNLNMLMMLTVRCYSDYDN